MAGARGAAGARPRGVRLGSFVLWAAAAGFLATGLFHGRYPGTQAALLGVGVVLLAAGLAVRRWPRLLASDRRLTVLLAALFLLGPLLWLELVLRPLIIARPTTIFTRDPALGWRLRPGAEGTWGGVRVEINEQGMRGPAVALEKPVGVRRILCLGDSVAFGFGLARAEESWPARLAAHLDAAVPERVDAAVPERVETVNAGVGGWSPWQQRIFLEAEGLRYAPDLVLVGFVLNDVTEKFELRRFGGTSEGFQVHNIAETRFDAWASHSALLSVGRMFAAYLRFGGDPAEGARRAEVLRAEALATHPRDPAVRRAWRVTLRNLAGVFALAEERGVPAALVVFPNRFQLDDPARLAAPQALLRRFAREREVPLLDLLPVLAAADEPPAELFIDHDHLTARGSDLAARAIADFVAREGLLRAAGEGLAGSPGGGRPGRERAEGPSPP